ncbi:MAG: prephenate dehydratase [Bacteroidales bacterium]|nr:prephenate dehydratase [Bacteroidales bacterium]MBN2818258.1 prephenate dehydratase [Bacteroidales bacterium]
METETKPKSKTIAIQGGYGAFHEIAAIKYFGDENIEIVPRNTFKDLFQALKKGIVDFGITAIENSLAGSILPNYSLLLESRMKIIGEIYLRIKQNLVALPGQKIQDIKEVYSHPMAILQCQSFFDDYPKIKLVDSVDTALSAKMIADEQLTGIAAIASDLAAKKYKLEIVAEQIETNKMNYTRFLILQNINGSTVSNENANKASLSFALAHQIGSLSKILSIFSFHDINLSKIQSMPIIGKDWEYQFYVDVEIADYQRYLHALSAINPFTSGVHILGEYTSGRKLLD